MLALLFEVTPKADGYERYLEIAAGLRPALDKHDGFLFIDRYRSLSRPQTILSHSLWRDEAALAAWRTYEPHHHAQVAGRESVFADYRLRIAHVLRARTSASEAWQSDSPSSYNAPGKEPRRNVVIATYSEKPSGRNASDTFESLNRPGAFLSVYEVSNMDDAMSVVDATAVSVRVCEIERDYGMRDRREAPQYYPPLGR
jgi:heme-degrading monooxygenase HmoA